MICDRCGINEAIIKYTQDINGDKKDYNLCMGCFSYINDTHNFSDDFMNIFFNNFFSKQFLENTYDYDNKCNICGNTFLEFKQTGKMGCENCYRTFSRKIVPFLDDVQNSHLHKGKHSKSFEYKKGSNRKNIEELKEQLKKVIENEDYETAIKIRDMIKDIERGI